MKTKKKLYNFGGPGDDKTKTYTNKAEYDKALQAYNDSLFKFQDAVRDKALLINDLRKEGKSYTDKVFPISKFPSYQESYKNDSNKPVAIGQISIPEYEWDYPFYKKPVVKPEYNNPDALDASRPKPQRKIRDVIKTTLEQDYWNTDKDVLSFRKAYKTKFGEEPIRDASVAKYDYDAAYKAGARPSLNTEDGLYHWDSRFKADDHPNRYVDGVDTKTGKQLPIAKGTMESEPKPINTLNVLGKQMSKEEFVKKYSENAWMKATGQKFAYGGKVPPGDSLDLTSKPNFLDESPKVSNLKNIPGRAYAEKMYDTVAPTGYNDIGNYYRYATDKKRTEFIDPISEEGYKQYLGINDNPKYLSKSQYKPSISKDPNASYYKLPDSVEQNIWKHGKYMNGNSNIVGEMDLDEKMQGWNDYSVLGNVKISRGSDSLGDYVSYYDKYDLPDYAQERLKGKPFEFYNKQYLPKQDKGAAMDEAIRRYESMKADSKKEYGGQMKKKFYAFGSSSTNTVGSQYTVGKDGKALASDGSTAPKSNYTNYAGYASAVAGAVPQIVNTWKDPNTTTYGKIANTGQDLGRTAGSVAMGPFGSTAYGLQDMVTEIQSDGKYVINKDTGRKEPVLTREERLANNVTTDLGTQDIKAVTDIVTGESNAYDWISLFGGSALGSGLEAMIEGGKNEEEYAKQQAANINYTSGDSSMKAYAFGGPMPVFPKGTNPNNKFTDFKDSTFKTHADKGIGITKDKDGNIKDEVEKNESMYRFGRTKKATGGSSEGGYVFSHILGEDELGNVSVVPQGTKAPKGWKSYADMSRETMS